VTLLLDLAHALGTTVDNLLSAGTDGFKGFDEILNNIEIIKTEITETEMLREIEENLSKINDL
jgi:hypothetical protein